MSFEFYKESYAGSIREITIGKGSKKITIGGETCYPFYQFEGDMPYKPKVAMEIWDTRPNDWPEAALSPFEDVLEDPAAWAKKCVDSYGAEIVVLQLKSTDPNGMDATPESAAATVKKVLSAIDVPLVVWGIANSEKDEAVFKEIAETCQDTELVLGPVEEKNHKSVGAAAMGYGHFLVSSSPIDVNLAKQVNILLENLGMPMDRILIDPTTGGLGYGLEYAYSVMERLRMAALTQGDDKLQIPILNNLGNEIWKSKEVKQSFDDAPLLGDPEKRGILMEAVGAVTYLMAGSDLLVMRHPESVRLVKFFIDLIMSGGSGEKVSAISKRLGSFDFNLSSLSSEPDLTIEQEDTKKEIRKKGSAGTGKPVKKKYDSKPHVATSGSQSKVEPEVKLKDEAKLKVEDEAKLKTETEAKLKAEAEVKLKAETEAKLKAETEAKLKAETEAKLKAETEAKLKAEAEAEAKLKAERENQERTLKEKREMERKKINKAKKEAPRVLAKNTPAAEQKSDFDKIVDRLQWIHKRVKLYKW